MGVPTFISGPKEFVLMLSDKMLIGFEAGGTRFVVLLFLDVVFALEMLLLEPLADDV